MNQYYLIRRLRGPAILLLIGTVALLDSTGVIHHFWHLFWPLLLILLGILMLAERAALAAEGGYPMWPFSGSETGGYPPSGVGATPPQEQSTSIVPAPSHDLGKDSEGGQL